jgi:hypothetical protein
MTNPHRGQRPCRALAILFLLTTALVFTLPGRQAAAGQQRDSLMSDLLPSIEEIAGALDQAAMQGQGKEARQLDRALEDLIRALDGDHKHHHDKHDRHGHIHDGMSQFANNGSDSQSSNSQDGSGKDSKGRHHDHKSSFGKGMNQVAGSSQDQSSSKSSSHKGVNSGMSQVASTINNNFSGAKAGKSTGWTKSSSSTGTTTASTSTSGNSKKTSTSTGTGSTAQSTTAGTTSPTTSRGSGTSKTGSTTASTGTAKSATHHAGASTSKSTPTGLAKNSGANSQGSTTMANKGTGHPQTFAQVGKMPTGFKAAGNQGRSASDGTASHGAGQFVHQNFNNSHVGSFVGNSAGFAHTATTGQRRR